MDLSTTACFGMNDICCVTVDVETHVSRVKMDDGVYLCFSVVHQNLLLFDGVGGGRSFLGANFIEREENGGINGT